MGELFGLLCVLLILLAFVMLVRHGLWLLAAAVGRALFGKADAGSRPSDSGQPHPCARCGKVLESWQQRCPQCKLHRDSAAAVELRELEATARQVQRFLDQNALDHETCERLYQCIEVRQHALMEGKPGEAAPVPAPAAELSPAEELERLLAGCADVRNLTFGNRQRALACYRRGSEEQLASLSAPALLSLARLLRLAGLISRSLQSYRLRLLYHPEETGFAEAALEAARCAERHNEAGQAEWFLEQALARPLSAELRAEAEALLAKCRPAAVVAGPPASQEILDVLPAEPGPVSAPPRARRKPAPAPVAVAEEALPPRHSLGHLLTAFMEESNILWGELVGGLLIVGCSIALVISLWQTLEKIPYFPFVIFALVTAALFGAGLYTLHRWKLHSTSRGLLVISMLLVPLNFLVLAGLSKGRAGGLLEVGLEAVAVLGFAWLVSRAARVVADPELLPGVEHGRWLLALAVIGPSLAQLLVPRLVDLRQPAPWLFYLIALLPVACHGLPIAAVLHDTTRREPPRDRTANALFAFLGIAVFALAVALSFLIYWSDDLGLVLNRLAVPVALAAVAPLAAGLVIQRSADASAPVRTGGTAVALVGAAVMLVGVPLAWPQPAALVGVCLLDFAVLTVIALRAGLPLAHAAALPCLAAGWLTAFHLLAGNFDVPAEELGRQLLRQAFAAKSVVALMPLVVLVALASELLTRLNRKEHASWYAGASAVGAVWGLILMSLHGRAEPGRAALAFGVYGLGCLAMNVRRRWWQLSYVGTTLVLIGFLFFTLHWRTEALSLRWRELLALLLHAVLFLAGSLAVGRRLFEPPLNDGPSLATAFVVPFRRAALGSTLLALPLMVLVTGRDVMVGLTAYVAAVAVLWLVIALLERWPVLFSAFQAAVTAAVLLGVTAWLLANDGWVKAFPTDLLSPWSQQAYGVGLGLLSLAWAVVRRALPTSKTAEALLEPRWPAVDRVVLAALVGGQLALAVAGIVPGMVEEFRPFAVPEEVRAWCAQATGPGAWLLLGLLAAVLAVTLVGRRAGDAVVGLVVLALTVPVLIAGPFRDDLATATALRWGLAGCFLAVSVPIWLRRPLARFAVDLAPESVQDRAATARQLLVSGCVVPVLVLTAIVAAMGFAGERPVGPRAGTFFRETGFLARHLVPLGLISAVMVGHALRERSAGYAFAAGLIANATVTGGYALTVVLSGGQLGSAEWVRLLQLGAGAAALWAIAWLWVRRYGGWIGLHVEGDAGRPLRLLQVGIGNALLTALLVGAVWLLIAPTPVLDTGSTAASYLAAPVWVREAGAAGGWLVLALAVTASVLYSLWNERAVVSTELIGLFALALVALLACTVERLTPGGGYRTLMLGLAVAALLGALTLGRLVSASTDLGREVGLIGLAGVPALLLAIKAAAAHQDQWWAAGTGVLCATTAAVLALQRRQEAWAFASGLCASFAVSLVVWRIHLGDPLADWWVYLVQASVITLAAAALLWLDARRRIYEPAELAVASSPLLAVQIGLALLGNVALLLLALGWLLAEPGGPRPAYVQQAGEVGGWLGLLLTTAAVGWYVRLVGAEKVIHAAGVAGLLLGIVAACFAGRWDQGSWLSHHVLTVMWSMLGLTLLAAGWAGDCAQRLGPAFWSDERRARAAERLATFFPARAARRWVETLGLLVVGLALRGAWGDPARPYWSSAAVLGVSAMAGILALWSRRPGYVYASGLLLNVVGVLVWLARQAWPADEVSLIGWLAWGPGVLNSFLYTNVFCLALASAFWSAAELALWRRTPPIDLRGRLLPFTQAAALAALQLLAVLVLGGIASDLTATGVDAGGPLAWVALAAAAVAVALGLWDERTTGWAWPGLQLYGIGLLAVGLGLHAAHLTPRWLCWNAALALAGLALFAAVVVWSVPRQRELWRRLRLPDETTAGPGPWFAPAQLVVGLLVVALSAWMSLDFGTLPQRLAGPLAVGLLLPSALMATDRRRSICNLQFAIGNLQLAFAIPFLVGVLFTAELSWAFLDPAGPAPWLHRNVLLMVALALLAVAYGLGLERLLGGQGEWARAAKQMGPLLGLGAFALLAVVLVQEFVLYDPVDRKTPLMLPFVIVVAVALLILMAGSIVFAVVPGRDPFGLSERGRTLYVYAGEALLVLTLVHLRLNVPDFLPKFVGQYWPLVIMTLAFLGVGLSEWFERRGHRVLAEPLRRTGLFLPLLPVVAYLLRPLTELRQALGSSVTGLQPLIRYLERLPAGYGMHAAVWFLLGGLYTLVALTRRSSRYALLAALAANFGLWVILANHEGTGFLTHPQFWLVPLALILLVAEHLNRDRLEPAQAAALRYAALMTLYLSSTADMFIAGLGRSVAWPVVLALLAIAGVLTGIVLRVRAFLYLGVAFLFLVIFAQIWHAAVDRQQTWVWWASGIALGVAILTLFAVFEKRRNDVLRLVEEIKKWD